MGITVKKVVEMRHRADRCAYQYGEQTVAILIPGDETTSHHVTYHHFSNYFAANMKTPTFDF